MVVECVYTTGFDCEDRNQISGMICLSIKQITHDLHCLDSVIVTVSNKTKGMLHRKIVSRPSLDALSGEN